MAKQYECPLADIEWDSITCKKDGKPCGHTRYCKMKGRLILTEQAEECTFRKDDKDEQRADADKNGINELSDKRRKRKSDN